MSGVKVLVAALVAATASVSSYATQIRVSKDLTLVSGKYCVDGICLFDWIANVKVLNGRGQLIKLYEQHPVCTAQKGYARVISNSGHVANIEFTATHLKKGMHYVVTALSVDVNGDFTYPQFKQVFDEKRLDLKPTFNIKNNFEGELVLSKNPREFWAKVKLFVQNPDVLHYYVPEKNDINVDGKGMRVGFTYEGEQELSTLFEEKIRVNPLCTSSSATPKL